MILRFLGLLHVERQTGLVTVRVVTVSIQQSAVTVLIFNVLVQVVVDKVEFGRFLANVLLVDGHADQMHLHPNKLSSFVQVEVESLFTWWKEAPSGQSHECRVRS